MGWRVQLRPFGSSMNSLSSFNGVQVQLTKQGIQWGGYFYFQRIHWGGLLINLHTHQGIQLKCIKCINNSNRIKKYILGYMSKHRSVRMNFVKNRALLL